MKPVFFSLAIVQLALPTIAAAHGIYRFNKSPPRYVACQVDEKSVLAVDTFMEFGVVFESEGVESTQIAVVKSNMVYEPNNKKKYSTYYNLADGRVLVISTDVTNGVLHSGHIIAANGIASPSFLACERQ